MSQITFPHLSINKKLLTNEDIIMIFLCHFVLLYSFFSPTNTIIALLSRFPWTIKNRPTAATANQQVVPTTGRWYNRQRERKKENSNQRTEPTHQHQQQQSWTEFRSVCLNISVFYCLFCFLFICDCIVEFSKTKQEWIYRKQDCKFLYFNFVVISTSV